MSASETVQSLAAVARAATERVAHSIAGESAPMSWAQAEAEIEGALATLERAGYRVISDGTSRRMPLVRLTTELQAAVSELEEAGAISDVDQSRARIDSAGARLERVGDGFRWLVSAPGSDVLERILTTVAANAARPTAEALQRLGDELPGGEPEPALERARAVEAAFRAALEWAPAIARNVGEDVMADALADLAGCQASYIAAMLRDDYSAQLSGPAGEAMTDAAAALEAARLLEAGSGRTAPVDVAELAALVLVRHVELRLPGAVEALTRLTTDLIELERPPVPRDLS